ncbi:gamma-glutamyltransferase [Occultella aeris]|uniref:Capsule biosynthesis protein CapD n=1 Tax=Occultella aeris TaxID=2761496 RepID=A0A7M4DKQ2_9MICO|nr:gamma-glutamyltransferase [Occultella aeris]VZO37743.1 Capsule biosynthesis protein CapD precursor [Occultella aeris]
MPFHRGSTIRAGVSLAVIVLLVACTASPPVDPVAPTTGTAGQTPAPVSPPAVTTSPTEQAPVLESYAVSAAHPAAVEAGMSVLSNGGNAVDAAIAAAFAVSVVEPFASGLGGGGSAIIVPPGAEPQSYDYREVVAQDGVIPASGTGIPGFVAGMSALHQDRGQVEWADLLQPAIGLAADGFPITEFLALRMRSDYGPAAIDGQPQFHGWFRPLAAGDELVQEDLAATLSTLASEGPTSFYTGALAEQVTRVDGIDAASLAAYEVVRAQPVRGAFGDHTILSAAPALPGVALIQMLQTAQALGVGDAEPGSADYVEDLSLAWQIADESVLAHLGDPAFVDVPVQELTDPARNATLAQQVNTGSASTSAMAPLVPGNTTHLTVVDSAGLMVSMTNTITNFWGGADAQAVGGFFMNNQLSRFETIDTPSNQPEPGRRSVSWAAPTVVLDNQDRPVLGIGSPGGHQIPNILANVITRGSLHQQSLEEAVAAPRFHLQDGILTVEVEPTADLAARLDELGWSADVVSVEEAIFGSVQALQVDYDTGQITGTADHRREATFAIGAP